MIRLSYLLRPGAHRIVWSCVHALFLAMVASASGVAQDVPVSRLIIAYDPPTVETNLFWETDGATGLLLPTQQTLVGNDVTTGAFDNSGLAESWEANEDFTEWTFHINPRAEFQFGWGPVTVRDVAFSYEMHTQDAAMTSGVHTLRGAKLEIVDEHTIKFIFDKPRQGFLFDNASRSSMMIYSKAQYDAEGIGGIQRKPAGTGHWQFVERYPGSGVLYERVENHWSGQDARFQEVEFRWAPEPATKLALLLSGEAHVADLPRELHPDAIAQGMKVIGSTNVAMHVTGMFNGLYLRSGDPAARSDLPWADVRIREAMNRALNRDEMIDVLYDGRADKLVVYGMHPPHEGYVLELVERFEAEYGYDPERAKELLKEAGYPDAFPEPVIPIVSTVLQGNPEFPTMAELFQVYFEAIGLQTEIREMDFASLSTVGRARQAYLIHPIRNAPIRPTEVHMLNAYTSEGSHFHGFENDHIQAVIEKLVITLDPGERDRIAQEAFTYLFEQYADMPIAAVRAEITVNPKIVADWPFPGVTSEGVSHMHLIVPTVE